MGVKRLTQHSPYFLQLGAEYLNKTIIPDSKYQTTLRRVNLPIEREAFIHMMFDESGTIEGARIAVGLLKSNASLDTPSTCTVKIYTVSNDATPWIDTLVKTVNLTPGSDKLFKTTIDSTEALQDIFGDVTFKVVARVQRGNDVYYAYDYFNHLGLTDKVERLRKKVSFLEITKRDFGT
jgi:hypothetical protein